MVLIEALEKYMTEQEPEEEFEEEGDESTNNEIFGMMVNLICSLDPEILDDDQYDLLGDILESFGLIVPDQDEEDEVDDMEEDALFEKRIQKIKRRYHLALHREYKQHKAQLKMLSKRFRRTAKYKMWTRRHKRMVRAGRTKRKKYV